MPTKDLVTTDNVDLRVVPIEAVQPNEYNPNVMSDEKFNKLVDDVSDEGMDMPIVVVQGEDGNYTIVDGEHRWTAAKLAGAKDILVSVREYTDRQSKLNTVRRNSLRGTLDKGKFMRLIADLGKSHAENVLEISDKMGLCSASELDLVRRSVLSSSKTGITKSADAKAANSTKEKIMAELMVGLEVVLREVLKSNPAYVSNGAVAFVHKGKAYAVISMNKDLRKFLFDFCLDAKEDGIEGTSLAEELCSKLGL